jgi:hypothetical protein
MLDAVSPTLLPSATLFVDVLAKIMQPVEETKRRDRRFLGMPGSAEGDRKPVQRGTKLYSALIRMRQCGFLSLDEARGYGRREDGFL